MLLMVKVILCPIKNYVGRDSQVKQWLNDCEKMLVREKDAFPILNYHLSLIYAMKGNELQSKRTFEAYINE